MSIFYEYLMETNLYSLSLVGILVINSITWLLQRRKVIEDLWLMRCLWSNWGVLGSLDWVHSVSGRVKTLGDEIQQLRQEAEKLSSPENFVQSAKLKRVANAKEKEMESVWQELQGNHKSKGARNLKLALMASLAIASWGVPVGEVPFATTWGSRFFRFPHSRAWCGQSCVAVIPWLAMVDRTTNALLRVMFPISLTYFRMDTKTQ